MTSPTSGKVNAIKLGQDVIGFRNQGQGRQEQGRPLPSARRNSTLIFARGSSKEGRTSLTWRPTGRDHRERRAWYSYQGCASDRDRDTPGFYLKENPEDPGEGRGRCPREARTEAESGRCREEE